NSRFTAQLLADLKLADPSKDEATLVLEQLRIYEPRAAWEDPTVRAWLQSPSSMDLQAARDRLLEQVSRHYNRRAQMLKESHPLGIQVNLDTGVANGVLVVRTVDDCARLVKRILTHTLEFDLTEESGFSALREAVSQCVYRVM